MSSKPGAACNTASALNMRSLQSMTRIVARSKAAAPRSSQACRAVQSDQAAAACCMAAGSPGRFAWTPLSNLLLLAGPGCNRADCAGGRGGLTVHPKALPPVAASQHGGE